MIPTLQDIKLKLVNNDYSNEDQVRFSLITRILQKLGWDIWNPNECSFEYPVKKFPLKDISKDENGRVDIALFLSKDNSPEVFIETKTIGMLSGNYNSQQEQLSRYNYYETSAISILTDGMIWKFYLPSALGTFSQKLFREVNLIKDDEFYISDVFMKVLQKDNFRKKAINASIEMLEEQKIIEDISFVREEAEIKSKDIDVSIFEIAAQLLKNRFNKIYSSETIERLWNRNKTISSKMIHPPKKKVSVNTENKILPFIDLGKFNPSGLKPKEIFIIDSYKQVSNWAQVFCIVCEEILKKYPNAQFDNFLNNNNIWKNNENVKILTNGMYLYCNFSSSRCLELSQKYLELYNFKPTQDFFKIRLKENF